MSARKINISCIDISHSDKQSTTSPESGMDDNNKSETESKKGSKKSRKDKKDRRRNSGKYQFHMLERNIFVQYELSRSRHVSEPYAKLHKHGRIYYQNGMKSIWLALSFLSCCPYQQSTNTKHHLLVQIDYLYDRVTSAQPCSKAEKER